MISRIIADDDTSRNDDGEFNEAYYKLMSNSNSEKSFGTLLLLGIPIESVISLDGAVRTVGREDFGVVGLQPNLFHLFSCRPSAVFGATSSNVSNALAVGIVMMVTSNDENWIVARKYDKRTEELSADELYSSFNHLTEIITPGALSWNHFFRYQDFVAMPLAAQQSNAEIADSWVHLVSHITPPLLKRRGIGHGDKIIPGAFASDDRMLEGSGHEVSEKRKKDGSLIVYPPIPCIDDEASSHVKKISHIGTKNFLKTVSPQDRTLLLHYHQLTTGMTFTSVGAALLENVLNSYYEGEWKNLVGDMQLSFLAFLYLGCLASFEHWRDLISMLSLSGEDQVSKHPALFSSVLDLLTYQLRFIEEDFFEEVDISSGNFFQPAIHKLLASCARCLNKNNCDIISQPFTKILETMKLRFSLCFKPGLEYGMDHSSAASAFVFCESNDDEKYKEIELETGESIHQKSSPMNCNYRFDQLLDDDFEGEEGPAIVPYEEIEDFLDRSSLLSNKKHLSMDEDVCDRDFERAYPCLFAARAGNPHEDIFMTCARILESASDVSLVRESAAFLEQMDKPFL